MKTIFTVLFLIGVFALSNAHAKGREKGGSGTGGGSGGGVIACKNDDGTLNPDCDTGGEVDEDATPPADEDSAE